MIAFEAGDVLRYDNPPTRDASYYDAPVWVLVTNTDPCEGIQLHGSWGGNYTSQSYGIGGNLPEDQWSGRYVVPPEEWPDEVCRAMALLRLTGDVS